MKNVNLNLGTGDVGGGCHDKPEVRRFVSAAATFLAGGLKNEILLIITELYTENMRHINILGHR